MDQATELEEPTNRHPTRMAIVGLCIVVLLGSALRIVGFDFHFPLLTHPDEHVVVDPAVEMSRNYSLIPNEYHRPNHISIYASFVLGNVVSLVAFHTTMDKSFQEHPTVFYGLARIISACFGVLLIVIMFLLAERLRRGMGLAAALLTALLPPLVMHSHYATPDVSLTLFIAVAIYFATVYLQERQRRHRILAIAFCALGVLEKYTGLLAFAVIITIRVLECFTPQTPFTMGAVWRWIRLSLWDLLLLLAFVYVLSPSLFLNPVSVIHALKTESRGTHAGAGGLGYFGNLRFYLGVWIGNGVLLGLLSAAGLVILVRRFRPEWIPSLFGGFFLIAISALSLHWERWLLPFYITSILLAALAVQTAYSSIRKHGWIAAGGLVAAGIVGLSLTLSAVQATASLTLKDTRALALAELDHRGISPQNLAGDGYSPFAPASTRKLSDNYTTVLENPDVRYIVTSSNIYNRFYANRRKYEEEVAIYEQVKTKEKLIFSVVPSPLPASSPWEWVNVPRVIGSWLSWQSGVIPLSGPRLDFYEKSTK